MKQLLTIVAFVGFVGATSAQAQDHGGVRVGFNAATLSTDDDTFDPNYRPGFLVGGFVVVPVNSMFAVQPEVLFSQQGARVADGSDRATIKLDYVQIPILARVRLGPHSPAHLLVGPSFGIRTKGETCFLGQCSSEAVEDESKSSDVGLVTGIGINLGPIVIDGRYTWGLMNLNKTSEAGTVNNRVLSLSAGFRF